MIARRSGARASWEDPVKSSCLGVLLLSILLTGSLGAARAHDYPTSALADYIFGCMASNGQSQDILQRCSCSIDVIASIVPYEEYVQAETIIRMRQVSGEKSTVFRDGSEYKKIVDTLRGAQAEADIRCF